MKAKMYNWQCWVKETRPDVLFARYESLLIDSGFHVVDTCIKMFSPQGFTALFLLSESHFAIHTFPERGKSYVELSSCVKMQFDKFVDSHEKYIYDATICDV
ncbi:MAG: S-adenosylmethionine decarboxylase [Clostridia bacterium]|nr:S-adenosylmethionine decarboxylase [Clostridia bacterium]